MGGEEECQMRSDWGNGHRQWKVLESSQVSNGTETKAGQGWGLAQSWERGQRGLSSVGRPRLEGGWQ